MKIEEIFKIPPECKVGSYIPKKQIFELADLKSRDKAIFTDNIKKIYWCYSLKEENIRISSFKDKERSYEEVEIIKVILKKDLEIGKIERIADIILRTFPYPMVLIFEIENEILLAISHIKEHKSDFSKITLEGLILTKWIDLSDLDEIDKKLFDSLNVKNLSYSHFYKFYSDIVDNINIYNGSKLVGRDLSVSSKLTPDEIKAFQEDIDKMNKEIELKRNQIKKETQFNKQVEINIEIKKIEEEIGYLEEILLES